jgi:23S rRNA maturation mini-RNase III
LAAPEVKAAAVFFDLEGLALAFDGDAVAEEGMIGYGELRNQESGIREISRY